MPQLDFRPPGRPRASGPLILLLLARLVLGLAFSAANPLGEAPDEADHYAYVVYVGQEGRLPVGTSVTQGKHPPFYYLVAAAASRAAGRLSFSSDFAFLRANPDVGVTADALAPNFFIHTAAEAWPWRDGALAMHLARCVSVAAGLLLVLATYGLGRGLWPARPEVALAGAAFIAFLPESLFVGASVSNDMLAAALSALALWLAVGGRGKLAALGTGIALGLGFLTKASVIAVWPIAGLAVLLVDGWRLRQPGRHVGRFLLLAAVATAIAAPWLWRNWALYGDPLGTPVVLGTIDRRQAPLDLAWLARGWFLSFWGKFGGAGHIPLPWSLYALWGVFAAGAVAGGLKAAGSRLQVMAEPKSSLQPRGSAMAKDHQSRTEAAEHPERVSGPTSLAKGHQPRTEAAEHPERVSGPTSLAKSHQSKDAGQPGVTLHPSTAVGGRLPTSAQDALDNGRWIRRLVLAGAPLLVILSMLSYSQIALGTDQGRLLFPALAPLGLLIAAGLAAWLPVGRSRWLAPVLSGVMLATALLALVFGIRPPFAPPLATDAQVRAAAPVVLPVADGLELYGATWGPETDTGREMTLYWRAAQPVVGDLRVIIRFYGDGDALLWEWKRSPGAGRYSTDRWAAGEVIVDPYRVPLDVTVRARRADVTLYAFPDEAPLGRAVLPLPVGAPSEVGTP